MKKSVLLLLLGIGAMLASAGVALAAADTGTARLLPRPNSDILAEVSFVDTGSELRVSGTATGMDPAKTYVSLLYDIDSEPAGPEACEPAIPPDSPGALTFAQMFVGEWLPVGSSTRRLQGVMSGSAYVPLAAVGTMSVREDVGPPDAPPSPQRFVLRACGTVHSREANG